MKEGVDSLRCNDTGYDLHGVALDYKDSMFWVYLGIYLALVLFAGRMYELIPSAFKCVTPILREVMLERKAIWPQSMSVRTKEKFSKNVFEVSTSE